MNRRCAGIFEGTSPPPHPDHPTSTTVDLGLALLDRLEGDAVLSPYGLARALGVFRAGATGAARAALDAVLSEPSPAAVDGLISAQAAWLGDDYAPGPKLTLDTGPLDADRVNAWSNEKTRGMIPRVVDSFTGDEILAITDAEYLDAKWEQPFTDTHQAPFEGVGEVPMMVVDGRFEHAEEAIRLPYAGNDLRFVAMLGEWREQHWQRGQGVVELPRFSDHHVGRPRGAADRARPRSGVRAEPGLRAADPRARRQVPEPHPAARPRRRRRGRHPRRRHDRRDDARGLDADQPLPPRLRPALHLGRRARADRHTAVRGPRAQPH